MVYYIAFPLKLQYDIDSKDMFGIGLQLFTNDNYLQHFNHIQTKFLFCRNTPVYPKSKTATHKDFPIPI